MEFKLEIAQKIARAIQSKPEKFSAELRGMAKSFTDCRAYWAGEERGSPRDYTFESASTGWKYIQAHKDEWEGKL